MKIAIDARAYAWAGIGRYTRNVLRELVRLPGEENFVVFAPESVRDTVVGELVSPRVEVVPIDDSYYSWREQTVVLQQMRKVPADVYHFTHFNVPMLFRRPYVVTVHDATRFLFPGQKNQSLFQQLAYEQVFRSATEHARAIICVSETTKEELARLPLRLPSSVEVIFEGVGNEFFAPVLPGERQKARLLVGSRQPFLLYVGVWMGHKNIRRMLQAFQEALREFPELLFVMTGRPKPGYTNVVKIAEELGVKEKVLFVGHVPGELLPALYAEAACLLFPSLYEGFGLPLLEASAVGTPVVTSNISSLPEIIPEGTYLVNPEYVPSIVDALRRVLTGAPEQALMVRAAKARAAHFSWETCAEETMRVYRTVVSSG